MLSEAQCIAELAEHMAAWNFFHDLFRAPSMPQWEWLNAEPAQKAWPILAEAASLPDTLPLPATFSDYEQTYIATFDVGVPAPPCPLIESHWRRSQPGPQIVHENLLFYRHFGLAQRTGSQDTSDHLRPQTEFMAYLCNLQSRLMQSDPEGERIDQLQRARQDFLVRHMNSWIPAAAAELNRLSPPQWIADWLTLLDAHVQSACAEGGTDDRST